MEKLLIVPLMSELFYQKVNHYNLRSLYEFSIPNVNSVVHGQASIRYLGPLIWQLVLSEFKDLNTVSACKAAIRKCNPNNCPCRLCKTYIIYWKCWIYLNYLFGVNNICWVKCRFCFPGFLVEEFSMSGWLVILKCFIFIFIFLILKFLFTQFIFPPLFWLT